MNYRFWWILFNIEYWVTWPYCSYKKFLRWADDKYHKRTYAEKMRRSFRRIAENFDPKVTEDVINCMRDPNYRDPDGLDDDPDRVRKRFVIWYKEVWKKRLTFFRRSKNEK